jgi:hypothetical protein
MRPVRIGVAVGMNTQQFRFKYLSRVAPNALVGVPAGEPAADHLGWCFPRQLSDARRAFTSSPNRLGRSRPDLFGARNVPAADCIDAALRLAPPAAFRGAHQDRRGIRGSAARFPSNGASPATRVCSAPVSARSASP